jgi:dihydroorotate dehydrogenase (fumarate)
MAEIKSEVCGLTMRSPIIVGSSGLTDRVDRIVDLASAGAGAIVLKSIFEEQILNDAAREAGKGGVVYGQDEIDGFIAYYERKHTVQQQVKLVKDCKSACDVPVIASVNSISDTEWQGIGAELADAGADALQLNLFISPFDQSRGSEEIEGIYAGIVRKVKAATAIPVIAKIGAYFTSIPRMVRSLELAGADGIVLFNRYYSPDFNIEAMALKAASFFSQPTEYAQALRWISLLSRSTGLPVIGASGVHDGEALIKMILAGSPAVEVVSTLYKHGSRHIKVMNETLSTWMDAHGFATLEAFRGKLAVDKGADRKALERFQYMKTYGGDPE